MNGKKNGVTLTSDLFPISKALLRMIVDHSHRLHESIANRRTNELEASLAQVFAHDVRFGSSRRNLLQRGPAIENRLAANKLPDVTVETAELLLHGEKRLRVLHGRLDLKPVAHDAGVL